MFDYPSGQPNNPWSYVASAATGSDLNPNQPTSAGNIVSQANPQGRLVVESGQAVFKQTYSGGISNTRSDSVGYACRSIFGTNIGCD